MEELAIQKANVRAYLIQPAGQKKVYPITLKKMSILKYTGGEWNRYPFTSAVEESATFIASPREGKLIIGESSTATKDRASSSQ